MAGHVFIAQGDITKLHCDAWLLPSDVSFNVGAAWRGDGTAPWSADLARLWRGERQPPTGWGSDAVRVAPLENAPGHDPAPQVFLVDVGRWAGTPVDWYMEGVRQSFVAVAAKRDQRVTTRPKPLIALPLIGTGDGGGVDKKGDLIRALLTTLRAVAAEHDLDIALIARGAQAFAAIQHARWQLAVGDAVGQPWPELDPEQRELAIVLAARARAGRLVLFLGAGVSMGAGLPSWNGLLADLAAETNLDEKQREALKNLSQADQARIIGMRLAADNIDLGEAVADRLAAAHHSLAHSLLATLPVNEIVTLNYDRLFEMAAEAADRPAAVLPYQPTGERARWLLKLHGCVQHPDDIVLTREDYLHYADRRAALSGIVQALLITRHMLFVGFSLTDEHFNRIVDDVRKALQGTDGDAPEIGRFGTALLLRGEPFLEELWQDSVRPVGMANVGAADGDAARRLDIFLDLLLAEATPGAVPLLDLTYDGILTPEERKLRDLLRELECRATPTVKNTPAWRPIDRLLRELGGAAPRNAADRP